MGKKGAAQAQKKDERILRVGVIQGGKIVEERLFDAGESASIGNSPKNTFVVRDHDIPAQHRLFVAKGKRYFLAYTDGMKGKLSIGTAVQDLEDLRKRGKAQQRGAAWVLPLNAKMRGKIQTGSTTILFQFVPPPPRALRRGAARFHGIDFSEWDWLYTVCNMLSAILGLAFLLWTSSMPIPDEITMEDIPERFVKLVVEPSEPEELPEPIKDENADGPATEEKSEQAEAKPQKSAAEKAESESARRDRLREQVKQKGLLAMIGARADAGGGDAVADLLSDTSGLAANLDSAMQGISGVKVATIGDTGGPREGTGSGELAGVGDLAGAGGGTAGSIQKQTVQVSGSVDAGNLETVSSGNADMDAVGSVMRKNLGRVKSCYERELKTNPSLQGKVKIKFKIGSGGTVSNAATVENTTGSTELATCIISRVKRISFPASGAGAEVIWPLNLFPSG